MIVLSMHNLSELSCLLLVSDLNCTCSAVLCPGTSRRNSTASLSARNLYIHTMHATNARLDNDPRIRKDTFLAQTSRAAGD